MSKQEGWIWKVASGRRHYFVDGLSLCGMWIVCRHEDPYIEPEPSAECLICRKILETNQKKKAA